MEKSERKRIRKRIMSWALAFFTTMSAVDVSGWGSIAAHAEEAVSVGAFEVTGVRRIPITVMQMDCLRSRQIQH